MPEMPDAADDCANGASIPVNRSAKCRLRSSTFLGEKIQGRQRRPASQRIARIGMGMQKTARDGVVIERGVHGIGGQHDRQWQIAAGQALGQAEKIRTDAGLLVGEKVPVRPNPTMISSAIR